MALGLCAYTGQTHGDALLVDCDPQATAYEVTELLTDPGYEVVHELNPAELARIKAARGFDLVAVDCPGSLEGGEVLGTVLQWTDYALVPDDHEMTSLPPTIKTCRYIEEHGTPYAVVVNNVDPRLALSICWPPGRRSMTLVSRTSERRCAATGPGARACATGCP